MATAQQTPYPVLQLAIDAIVSFFTRSFQKLRAAQELRDLPATEVSAIARDLCLTQDQLESLMSAEVGFPKPLKGMLALLKIDDRMLQQADAGLVRDMQTVCALCSSKRRCARAMRNGKALANFREYCPNSGNLDAIRQVAMPSRQTLAYC